MNIALIIIIVVAIIVIATFAAIMTPTPDVWTMFLLSAPLLVLFYGSAGLALVLDKIRGRREAKSRPEWMEISDDKASAL